MRHEWVANHLAHMLDALPLVLGTAPEEALSERPSSGKWSAREHLAHLARHHEVMLERLHRILREQSPELQRYIAERDADWPAWSKAGLPEILTRLQELRTALVREVEAITESDRGRVGIHSKYGAMDVTAWLVFFLLHEAHHLYIIMGQRGAA
ncbi:MAG TPA: DinB family protein [Blastocatellia bacterium]|nr:DinB family protein [Blastocatellia bacterium]